MVCELIMFKNLINETVYLLILNKLSQITEIGWLEERIR